MSFSVHTFETNPSEGNFSFSFHEVLGEGQEIFFLAKFDSNTSDAKDFAESVFGAIIDNFQNTSIKNKYDLFEDSLKIANLEIQKRRQQIPRIPEVVVALFDFHNLYLSQSGDSEAYMIRGANVSQITESSDNEDSLFSNILSGQIAVNDTIVLSSSRVLRALTSNQLVDIFDRNDFSDSVSLFKHELANGDSDDMLITIIGVGKTETSKSSGFLSKVVSKTKKKTAPELVTPIPVDEPIEDIPQEDLGLDIKNNDIEEPLETTNDSDSLYKKGSAKIINIFVRLKRNNPQRSLIIISGAVISIFILALGIKFVVNYESENTKELREKLSISRESLKQADEFLFEGERKSASESLKKAEESAVDVLNSSSKQFRSDARYLIADIQEKKLQVENAKVVTPQLLADLGVKNDNIDGVAINELRGNLYVNDLNQTFKTIRSIVDKGITISEKETIIASTSRPSQNTLIYYTDSPRIIEYRDGAITPMTTEDTTWKKGIDINTYGRFVYILDPVENQIWKYERRRSVYSSSTPYNQSADLSRAISLSIDGYIFILSDDGTIQKLFRGLNEKYAFRDLPSVPFSGKNLKIFTRQGHDFIYILDPDNSRVLLFTKGERFATYKKQVIYGLPDARDFFINDAGQKVNILTKDKIYEFSL